MGQAGKEDVGPKKALSPQSRIRLILPGFRSPFGKSFWMSKTVCESSILVSGFRIRILIFQEVIPTPVRSLQERPEDSNRAEDSKPGGETPAPKPSFGRMTQRQA